MTAEEILELSAEGRARWARAAQRVALEARTPRRVLYMLEGLEGGQQLTGGECELLEEFAREHAATVAGDLARYRDGESARLDLPED